MQKNRRQFRDHSGPLKILIRWNKWDEFLKSCPEYYYFANLDLSARIDHLEIYAKTQKKLPDGHESKEDKGLKNSYKNDVREYLNGKRPIDPSDLEKLKSVVKDLAPLNKTRKKGSNNR